MGATLTEGLQISAEWEILPEGTPEEQACFAELGIRCHDIWLTEGHDSLVRRTRTAPYLSAYHLAEWLAWNWWRLRWEPRSRAAGWKFAHCLSSIGAGYVWPDITISSDGQRTVLEAKPTPERPSTAFRYICNQAAIIPSRQFEMAVEEFITQVVGQLEIEGVGKTNLETIWTEVLSERRDQTMTLYRKFEALLGHDPDEADPAIVTQLLEDAGIMGSSAMAEIAGGQLPEALIPTAQRLNDIATESGFDAAPHDVVRLSSAINARSAGDVPAWRIGAEMARSLREQEKLGEAPIENRRLAQMMGVEDRVLERQSGSPVVSFALDDGAKGRIVLRPKWETGRRFELARLLGDRLYSPLDFRLFPSTRSYTFRQKLQRSFAAEFLSPFEAVSEMLQGDYSEEKQQDVAAHFNVSELTIRTLLVNHHRLEREELDEDSSAGVA